MKNFLYKSIGALIIVPYIITVWLVVLAMLIGPLLITGYLAMMIGWVKFKTVFYWKYCLWKVKGWWWRKKQNFSK